MMFLLIQVSLSTYLYAIFIYFTFDFPYLWNRMATRCGYKVIALSRVRIAGILTIDSLPNPGSCRWLTSAEECQLKDGLKCEAVCDSTRAINPSLTCANDDALKAGGGSP